MQADNKITPKSQHFSTSRVVFSPPVYLLQVNFTPLSIVVNGFGGLANGDLLQLPAEVQEKQRRALHRPRGPAAKV